MSSAATRFAERVPGGLNLYQYAYEDPANFLDPRGTNPMAGTIVLGGEVGSIFGPVGTIAGVVVGAVVGVGVLVWTWDYFSEPADLPDVSPAPPGPGGGSCPAAPRPWPGWDPTVPPGPDFGWRGKPPVGGDKGNWHNPAGPESLHPDLNHPDPIGPHWDWNDPDGNDWRIYPDGRNEPK